jgi:hypothetical protein
MIEIDFRTQYLVLQDNGWFHPKRIEIGSRMKLVSDERQGETHAKSAPD